MSDAPWSFSPGDIIREEHEKYAADGVAIGRSECLIKWRLIREYDGTRCYYVETGEGGPHLYTATAIENTFETIDVIQSTEFNAADVAQAEVDDDD